MSDAERNRRPEGAPKETNDRFEQRAERGPAVEDVHDPIYREMVDDPEDGYEPISTWLIIGMFAVLMWGGWYLGQFSGGFDPRVYDRDAAIGVAAAGERPTAQVDPVLLGRRLYNNCATCHQADGKGVPGRYPPLAGSEWVTGDERVLARIVMNGLGGPIEVAGQRYEGQMPAWPQFGDREVAAVLTHVRGSFGNTAPPVDPATVAAVRAETAGRSAPWTAEELRQVAEAAPAPAAVNESEAADAAAAEPSR